MATASKLVSASSLRAVLTRQSREGILTSNRRSGTASGSDPNKYLTIALVNQTNYPSTTPIYAYITGLYGPSDHSIWLLRADGKTSYEPTSPPTTMTPLAHDCGIRLGGPGSITNISVPELSGGRIWFSIGCPLTFYLNPGPSLVEPSITNPGDPNVDVRWDFCEFSFNGKGLYANISYVDFVCLPIALESVGVSGKKMNVAGMAVGGLVEVCTALEKQSEVDGGDWKELVVKCGGDGRSNLRAMSPNNGIITNSALFEGYYEDYIDKVWKQYGAMDLAVDDFGLGRVSSDLLTFADGTFFPKPTTADVFSGSTGPFAIPAGASGTVSRLVPCLSAAFNRSTIFENQSQPDKSISRFYADPVTNHYSRICHSVNLDGLGYGFPYDDFTNGSGGFPDQSGSVMDSSPQLLTVTLGGVNATNSVRRRRGIHENVPIQAFQGYEMMLVDEKVDLGGVDIENGGKFPDYWEVGQPSALRNTMSPVLGRILDRMRPYLRPLLENLHFRRILDLIIWLMTSVLSASARAFVNRIILAVLVLLFYVTIELFNRSSKG